MQYQHMGNYVGHCTLRQTPVWHPPSRVGASKLRSFSFKPFIKYNIYIYILRLFSNKIYLIKYTKFSKLSYLYLLFESVLNFVSVFFLKKYNTLYIQLLYKERYFVNNVMCD